MKTKKLKLTQIKLESFVTRLDKSTENTIAGGFASIGKFCTMNHNCQINDRLTEGMFCTTRHRT